MIASTVLTPPGQKASNPVRTRGYRVIAWIETHCVFTRDEWYGKPFRLLPWQKRVILELFTLGADGLRQYWWAYLSVPKKNGKTELAAALALYLLIGDEVTAPFVVCAAASDDQADIVFGAARTMCEASPTLSAVTERFEAEITVPSIPGARLKRLAAAAGTNDGPNISAVISDELHEWRGAKGEQVWNVLTNGVVARREPFILQTTTAGFDKRTICGREYERAKAIERGEIIDRRYYAFIAEAPPDADYRAPATWAATNPSYGVTVREETLADQLTKKDESTFRRYFLNQWPSAERIWLPAGAWVACQSADGLDPKAPVAVGVSASITGTSAVVVAQHEPSTNRVVVRAKHWRNPYPEGHSAFRDWRLDLEEVRSYLRSLRAAYPAPATRIEDRLVAGPGFYCALHGFAESAQILEGEGLAMVEVPSTDLRLVPPTKLLYELVVTGRLAHDGDPILAAHIAAVVAKPRGDAGWRLTGPDGTSASAASAAALVLALSEIFDLEPVRRRAPIAVLA